MPKSRSIVFITIMVVALVLMGSLGLVRGPGPAQAQELLGQETSYSGENPPGCTANNWFLSLGKDKFAVHQGECINYMVAVSNRNDTGCDIENANVTFTQPAADGTATGNWSYLDTYADFPADGSGNKVYMVGNHTILHYCVNVTPGVKVIRTNAHVVGTLRDGHDSPAYIDKNMAVGVLWPAIAVNKTADTEFSKAGDNITYTIEVRNTGDQNLSKVSIVDSVLGDITEWFPATLAVGANATVNITYTVKDTDPDPLENKVTVIYEDRTHWAVNDTATHAVDLVHPDIEVTKSAAPTSAMVGDTITYTIGVENTGDVELILDSVDDSLLGSLAGFSSSLGVGASESHDFTRDIQSGDPDPVVNTVVFHYHPDGLPNDITDSDSASVELVSSGLKVTKEADTDISKVGDTITYTITVENSGDVDLTKTSIMDTLLGDISDAFAATLASGASESHDFDYVVPEGAADPLVNEVTAIYEDLAGHAVSDTATDTVDLVHPSIEVTKSAAPTSAMVGDTITYTIGVENTGDVELILDSVDDSLLGSLAGFSSSLVVGASESHDFTRDIQSGDADPVVNTVVFHYHPDGLPNDITDSDSASVDLVSPGLEVTKEADTDISKVGDTITYTITVENSGDVDLTKTSIMDTLLGDISDAFAATLASGASESHDFDYVVPEGAADPLVNEVTAIYEDLAGHAVSDTATDTVDLVHPSIEVTKSAAPTSAMVGDTITYTIGVENTGDVELILDSVDDSLLGSLAGFSPSLVVGASESHDFTRDIQSGDADPVVNTVVFHYHPDGLPNDITDSDSASVDLVSPGLEVTKEADTDISKVGDTIRYTITVKNSGDVELTKTSIMDTLLGDISDAFAATLASGASESHDFDYVVPDGAADPLVNEVTATYEDLAGHAVSDTATDTVDLVHPSIEVTKSAAPTSAMVGDTITYTISVENTGDVELILDSVDDSLLGSLAGFSSSLVVGASESHDFTRDIQSGDADPVVNTVVFHYHPDGLPNDITDQDDANVEITECLGSIQIEKRDKITKNIIDLPGTTFKIEPNPYDGEELTVVDNDDNDGNKANGIILLDNVPCGWYTITEIAAPQGYQLDSTPKIVEVASRAIVIFYNSPIPAAIEVVKTAALCGQGQGCTPGYWKNHVAAWPTGYDPSDIVGEMFDIEPLSCPDLGEIADDTLLEALEYPGGEGELGKARILLRGAVAAVLNAAHPDVNYPHAVNEVVTAVNRALASCDEDTMESLATALDDDNNLGCPLGEEEDEGCCLAPPPCCPGTDPLDVNIGDIVTYCYEVTNTGDVTLYDVTVVDDIHGPVSLPKTTLEPGESMNGTLTHEVVEGDAPWKKNTATATGTTSGRGYVSDSDDCIITVTLEPAELFFDSFEDDSVNYAIADRNWVEDSQNKDDWFCSTQRAVDGSRSAEVDGWAEDATLTLKHPINLSEVSDATLTFSWFIESKLDTGEYLALDLWNGTIWIEAASLRGNVDQENIWHNEEIDLGPYLIDDFKLRFRGKMSASKEDANVDAVRIIGY